MKRSVSIYAILLISLCLFFSSAFSQAAQDTTRLKESISKFSEEEFQVALTRYVQDLLRNHYTEALPQERFLVSLMRLVNKEMDSRLINRKAATEKYYKDLRGQLSELKQLKSRLRASNISELDDFIVELEARMKKSMHSSEVDYKKKKVFEDALQLLYIAEEMIKLDQLRDPSSLNKKISSSKDELLTAFGEVGSLDDVPLDVAPTIFNLFDEWRKTDSYKFTARLLDVQIARNNLLKSGSIQQINRMFNSQLQYAYSNFNFYEYDLAERLLEDVTGAYQNSGIKDFEDVYFYWAECNFALQQFLKAENIYSALLTNYPQSVYLAKTYSRLIQIAYKLENYSTVIKYSSIYQDLASPSDEDYYDIQFIVALSLYENSDYNRAVERLLSFPKGSDYYYFAQYLVGTIYATGQNYDLAFTVFESLAMSKSTPYDIHNRSLLKLAQLSYERGDYEAAIEYGKFVPENYYRYDKVLNVLAWGTFMVEQTMKRDPRERDFTEAKYYAYELLQQFYSSEHRIEAESLLGYIYQLEENPSLARDFYRDVYKSKMERNKINLNLHETDSLLTLYKQAKDQEEKALQEDDRESYLRAASKVSALENQMWNSQISAKSSIGDEVALEVNDLVNRLAELNQLKEIAKEQQNDAAVEKIEGLMNQTRSSLNNYTEEDIRQAIYVNAYPVAKKVADYDFRTQKDLQLQESVLQELQLVDIQLGKLEQEIERAKLLGNYDQVVMLEQKQRKLTEIRKKYDQLYVYAMGITPAEPYPEFDRWGDFGAVGIIDVNFGQRDKLQTQMSRVSTVYNSIIDKIAKRREIVDDQLKRIEAEIRFMTMKSRLEERQRLRAEREQSFRETFFDTRTSEFEEQ
jgi:hypothetical protein